LLSQRITLLQLGIILYAQRLLLLSRPFTFFIRPADGRAGPEKRPILSPLVRAFSAGAAFRFGLFGFYAVKLGKLRSLRRPDRHKIDSPVNKMNESRKIMKLDFNFIW